MIYKSAVHLKRQKSSLDGDDETQTFAHFLVADRKRAFSILPLLSIELHFSDKRRRRWNRNDDLNREKRTQNAPFCRENTFLGGTIFFDGFFFLEKFWN